MQPFRGKGAAALVVCAALAGVLPAAGTRAETLVVAGRPLELAPPFGFCRLSPEIAAEEALIDALAKVEEDRLRPALSFADCQELDEWRRGLRHDISRLGQIGALLGADGEPLVISAPGRFIEDLRPLYPAHAAAEIAARLPQDALLLEGPGYLVHARVDSGRSGAPLLHLAGLSVIGGVPLEVSVFLPATGHVETDGQRLAEAGGMVAASVGEIQVVNDIFADVEATPAGSQTAVLNLLTMVAGGFGLFGLLAIRSLWLLLRAPRRQIDAG
ncbi:hypothetical protein L2U69_10975 [Zavarzinia compransoris]|uniref:hypothetical protein n=1 Tax=Zavarzinia marina TaxID=2911065 RepID=UPI001F42E5E6|nr:hypothetical protein [Zavarzinia marina]MCF4166167.1 hypothetical protein [Zavarzinia marina]